MKGACQGLSLWLRAFLVGEMPDAAGGRLAAGVDVVNAGLACCAKGGFCLVKGGMSA